MIPQFPNSPDLITNVDRFLVHHGGCDIYEVGLVGTRVPQWLLVYGERPGHYALVDADGSVSGHHIKAAYPEALSYVCALRQLLS